MSKQLKPGKKTVELQPEARPSRIRREPLPMENALTRRLGRIDWTSREWEIRLAMVGIIFFALALTAAVFDLGEVMSRR